MAGAPVGRADQSRRTLCGGGRSVPCPLLLLRHLPGRYRLVVLTRSWDLFVCAKDLLIDAMAVNNSSAGMGYLRR
jgi:hypothetical protein